MGDVQRVFVARFFISNKNQANKGILAHSPIYILSHSLTSKVVFENNKFIIVAIYPTSTKQYLERPLF